jgi:hypothetical protein
MPGRYLLAANQNGDNTVVFGIGSRSVKLHPIGNLLKIAVPVCVKFIHYPPSDVFLVFSLPFFAMDGVEW